jgi:hypothetical protein
MLLLIDTVPVFKAKSMSISKVRKETMADYLGRRRQ